MNLSTFPLGVCFIEYTHLHPIVFFHDGLETISHVSFLTNALISSNIAFFHLGSCIASLHSHGAELECKEVINALHAGGNVSNDT
jgi:hypothetical protein